MRTPTSICISALIAFITVSHSLLGQAAPPINVDTRNLLVQVDADNGRWSAQVKGTPMQLNNVYFLPGDDASGWTITSSVNNNDANIYGPFVTVTLKGTKPGQLDFEYQVSASKTGSDILVSLGRSNNTGKAVDIGDMDYFVSSDARLGGTEDKWETLGTYSRNRDYYEFWAVINMTLPKTYQVNHVIRDNDTGNSLLMGHVTTLKGASRFEVASGWQGKVPDRMQVRGYCSYKVTMPPGKSFPGEKLLIDFSQDALRAMEHQGDLIALAHDIRLKERRPINLEDKELVANNYSRFHGWMSGGSEGSARQFFQTNGLVDFYWGMGGPGGQGSFGFYGMGGGTQGRASRVGYPAGDYLPVHTVRYAGEKVIDFSNPDAIQREHDRAFAWASNQPGTTGRAEMDFADWWDKWPGQFDPYMSALETYHAGGMPWREAIDQKAPRRVVRSNMEPVDHSYGMVDICRISEDADHSYEANLSSLARTDDTEQIPFTGSLAESVLGGANRFFYNGRVFWNDCDGFHIYKYSGTEFNAGQAKVDANFHAIAGSTLFVSEAFNVPYPPDRIELLKRICPPTMDVAYPVDLFVRRPAQIWNMPVERPFGKWCVLAVFNWIGRGNQKFNTTLDAAKDLRLDPEKDYIAYEFWSKQLIGTFKGKFAPRPVNPYDCDVYSIVEKQDHPVLISTSRHVRQMAFDIKDLAFDSQQRMLKGTSRAVAGDPYQLRIFVPDGFTAKRAEAGDGIAATMKTDGNLLTVDFTTATGKDVDWKVAF
ncbi:MAG: hypothetical protein ABSC18_12160 [Verrucomicrobiota bacterium]